MTCVFISSGEYVHTWCPIAKPPGPELATFHVHAGTVTQSLRPSGHCGSPFHVGKLHAYTREQWKMPLSPQSVTNHFCKHHAVAADCVVPSALAQIKHRQTSALIYTLSAVNIKLMRSWNACLSLETQPQHNRQLAAFHSLGASAT